MDNLKFTQKELEFFEKFVEIAKDKILQIEGDIEHAKLAIEFAEKLRERAAMKTDVPKEADEHLDAMKADTMKTQKAYKEFKVKLTAMDTLYKKCILINNTFFANAAKA